MSYILDALRKADAQRERDPARGIHAQSVTALPSDQDPDAASPLLGLALGVTGVAVLAAAAWWLARPDEPVEAPVFSAPASSSRAVAITPAPSPLSSPPTAPAAVLPMPAPATEVRPAAPPVRVLPPAPRAALPAATGSLPAGDAQRPLSTAPAPAQASAPAGERLLSVRDLPAEVQRDLPKLTITGSVYSADPAQRLLIVNGQVLNEGAEAAPGVMLTQIRLKTAVLTFRGWRYGVAY